MKILKMIWMFPAMVITLLYAMYCLFMVFKHSNRVELELLQVEGISKEILDKWIIPFADENKTSLRIFSSIVWMWFLINII